MGMVLLNKKLYCLQTLGAAEGKGIKNEGSQTSGAPSPVLLPTNDSSCPCLPVLVYVYLFPSSVLLSEQQGHNDQFEIRDRLIGPELHTQINGAVAAVTTAHIHLH